jgi:hypothetical protein
LLKYLSFPSNWSSKSSVPLCCKAHRMDHGAVIRDERGHHPRNLGISIDGRREYRPHHVALLLAAVRFHISFAPCSGGCSPGNVLPHLMRLRIRLGHSSRHLKLIHCRKHLDLVLKHRLQERLQVQVCATVGGLGLGPAFVSRVKKPFINGVAGVHASPASPCFLFRSKPLRDLEPCSRCGSR